MTWSASSFVSCHRYTRPKVPLLGVTVKAETVAHPLREFMSPGKGERGFRFRLQAPTVGKSGRHSNRPGGHDDWNTQGSRSSHRYHGRSWLHGTPGHGRGASR